ncbi:OmpA family protein [Flavobacterium antarcticum]|uniref:OmpA family protein n=1 Tax=Flavobacterium antarcticum TaxID=271155 RepID=UPI0003B44FC2|nr:OmpA family protein [Flavobacterium antarcticum]
MKNRFIFFVCFFIFAVPVWSQKEVERGYQQFENLAYSDAIISFEKAVEKGFGNPRIYAALADAYYFNANYPASAKWYQLLFKNSDNNSKIHYFRYAQTLKSIGKEDRSTTLLKKMELHFPNENTDDSSRSNQPIETNRIKNSGRFNVKLASFNSALSDFGPSYFGDKIVFASTRDTGTIFKRKHSWTNHRFTDLYVVHSDTANDKPAKFSKSINSKFNESTAVFTKDGLTVYFTRNNSDRNKPGTNEDQTTLLKIYKAVKIDEEWKVIGPLSFCSDRYNVAHPALSFDEKTMYFASDQPGGFGQSDLYSVAINDDGSFATPQNLGKNINTFGRETFPFASQNNKLYFSSDRHDGFGGLDIFVSNITGNFKISPPQNVGTPVNSAMDDFGFIMNETTKTGYFTSNRVNGIGMDDIYEFEEVISLPCETILEGSVVAAQQTDLQLNPVIRLLDANRTQISTTTADTEGRYHFTVECQQEYTIEFTSDGFVSQEIVVLPRVNEEMHLQNIIIQQVQPAFKIGDDLAKNLSLLPIYFDLGKWDIREDAAIELAKIKRVLQQSPSVTIIIKSHTDSRDTDENNLILSNKRAKATLKWFVENGIEANRLTGKGCGETELINSCADGIPCSEVQHQFNRRSEFIVTGI